MTGQRFFAVRDDNCVQCGFCRSYVSCGADEAGCLGCGACVKGCPQEAIHLAPRKEAGAKVRCSVNGSPQAISGPVSVLEALRQWGVLAPEDARGQGEASAHCGTGGCWNCAVLVNGSLVPACTTALGEGMEIVTDPHKVRQEPPRRVVTLLRPAPHYHPSVFVHGCNYCCPLCHNWDMTFSSTARALTPREAAERLQIEPSRDYWVGISGGEPTLNRRWLLDLVRILRDGYPQVRIQLDTNGSLLTPDYIDALVASGITDLSPDVKALRVETFRRFCGLDSWDAARTYLSNSWNAVRYVDALYRDRVFMAVSVPYHPRTHSGQELRETAAALAAIRRDLPVTLVEYQPAFRLRNWAFVSDGQMEQARGILKEAGLQRVIVQGGGQVPRALDPMDLALSSEEF